MHWGFFHWRTLIYLLQYTDFCPCRRTLTWGRRRGRTRRREVGRRSGRTTTWVSSSRCRSSSVTWRPASCSTLSHTASGSTTSRGGFVWWGCCGVQVMWECVWGKVQQGGVHVCMCTCLCMCGYLCVCVCVRMHAWMSSVWTPVCECVHAFDLKCVCILHSLDSGPLYVKHAHDMSTDFVFFIHVIKRFDCCRLWGEPVNLREQHDALEFFNSLVDSLDEALKSLSQSALLEQHLGGSFADQKICKDCPHR